MRAVPPVFVGMLFLLLIVGVGLVSAGATANHRKERRPPREWRSRCSWWVDRRTRRRETQVRRVPWRHYSRVDPVTGERVIGIERVYRDVVINNVEMHRGPDDDVVARLGREADAILRAVKCNDGMGDQR